MPLSFSTIGSVYWRPIRRLMAKKVLEGLVTAWRLAGWPTRRSPSSRMPTTDGVERAPSAFSITFGVLPSMMATHELVVPRSMPIILLMRTLVSLLHWRTLAGAFRDEAPVASFPVRFRLSFGCGREARAGPPPKRGKRRFRPDIGNATPPRKGFFSLRGRGETPGAWLDPRIQ